MKYLNKIKSPEDLKKYDKKELPRIADEAREILIEKISAHGGHIGPNLGMVEATVALHYVFSSPTDKIVFDVSHQSYVHKMLTGRAEAFYDPKHYDDVSGYTNPKESAHDFFEIGHTSTSVSLAAGLAKARDLRKGKENVIAVLGDGSLSGGEALEGLDFVGEMGTNFILVLNDNDQSIAENHGGIYKNLKELRETKGEGKNNLFKAFGLDYLYVDEGNDVLKLVEAFEKVKDAPYPVVVHIHTIKGKGLPFAEKNREEWHAGGPFNKETGERAYFDYGETYEDLTRAYIMEKAKTNDKFVVVNAATPSVFGVNAADRESMNGKFIDVGIAEEHAAAMCSGLAKNGARPLWGVYSTFIQRTYDQILQDICVNNSAVTIITALASVYGMSDVTHLGIYDIPMLTSIPNLTYLAPVYAEEYFKMIDWAIEKGDKPIAIRRPVEVLHTNKKVRENYDMLTFETVKKGKKIALIGVGNFFSVAEKACEILEQKGYAPTLINPLFVNGLDEKALEDLKKDHEIVVTIEDGSVDGGFGQKVAAFYAESDMKVFVRGIEKGFYDRYDPEELLKANGITPEQIVADVTK